MGKFAIVSQKVATSAPYPYIYVNPDGTLRELHADEREYLETPFDGGDGGRPWIKDDLDTRDGWGNIRGFLHRSKIPIGTSIGGPPAVNPNPPLTAANFAEELRNRGAQFDVEYRSDGTIVLRKKADDRGLGFLDRVRKWFGSRS